MNIEINGTSDEKLKKLIIDACPEELLIKYGKLSDDFIKNQRKLFSEYSESKKEIKEYLTGKYITVTKIPSIVETRIVSYYKITDVEYQVFDIYSFAQMTLNMKVNGFDLICKKDVDYDIKSKLILNTQICNFTKSKYISFDLYQFLPYILSNDGKSVKITENKYFDKSEKNIILDFITEDEFRKVYKKHSSELIDDLCN